MNAVLPSTDAAGLTLPIELWRSPRPGDGTVVARCTGPTLDVGCGPGRMAHAVGARGVPALGIDISHRAVEEARARGALALRRDVFGDLPGAGRWHHVLLLDGNIGIAGDPISLLARCRHSLRDGGTIFVEADPPGAGLVRTTLRLVIDGHTSDPVPWARVGLDVLGAVAAAAGVDIADTWTAHGRHFAALRRRDRYPLLASALHAATDRVKGSVRRTYI